MLHQQTKEQTMKDTVINGFRHKFLVQEPTVSEYEKDLKEWIIDDYAFMEEAIVNVFDMLADLRSGKASITDTISVLEYFQKFQNDYFYGFAEAFGDAVDSIKEKLELVANQNEVMPSASA
jgi:hypothetical protein